MNPSIIPRLHHLSTAIRSVATALGSLFLLTSSFSRGESGPSVTDVDINRAVASALLYETAILSSVVDVTVTDGTAILSGKVNNLQAKERAILAAKAVSGVRSVVDKIEVAAPPRSTAELAQDVIAVLALDPATDIHRIEILAFGSIVTLKGEVASWQERNLITHVAKSVRGVTGIENELTLKLDEERPDAEILTEIERAFEIDILLRPAPVDISVIDGVVTLSGTIGSLAEKERAVSKTWIPGVREVSDKLEISPWASRDKNKKRTAVLSSNDEIAQAVRDSFTREPRLKSTPPTVRVESGVVLLVGTVGNLKEREAAERAVRNTAGVARVDNRLNAVSPPHFNDEIAARNVNLGLALNAATSSHEITAQVEDGLATLRGSVDSYLEQYLATDVASRTNGVTSVRNNLEVRDPTLTYYAHDYDPNWSATAYYGLPDNNAAPPNDQELSEAIETRFFWSPFVDPGQIEIKADRGEVLLTGTVSTWSQHRAASENAHRGGALRVINQLNVD